MLNKTDSDTETLQKRFWDLLSTSLTAPDDRESEKSRTEKASVTRTTFSQNKRAMSTYDVLFKDLDRSTLVRKSPGYINPALLRSEKENSQNKNEFSDTTDEKKPRVRRIVTETINSSVCGTRSIEVSSVETPQSAENWASPFNSYAIKSEPIFRNSVESFAAPAKKGAKIYAPGQLLKTTPRLRIAHVQLFEDGMKFVFEVLSDVKWFVVKDVRAIRDLARKISKEVMASFEPEKIRLRKELVEIYVNSELARDTDSLQLFILTGVVYDYALRTGHLLVKHKTWIVVRARVLNRNLVLHSGQSVYKILGLDSAKTEVLSETMFGVTSRGVSLTFNTFSLAERNAWLDHLREQ